METKTIKIDVDSLAPGTSIDLSFTTRGAEPTSWKKPWFGGRNAPWAVPIAAGIRTHAHNDRLISEFRSMCDGSLNLNTHNWAITKHYYDASTPTAELNVERPEWCNMSSGQRVPWDPSWKVGDDGDSYVTIINRETGKCFLIWKTRYERGSNRLMCGTANRVTEKANSQGPDANIWKKENGYMPSRAAGIALPHMLVTREELEAGEINHCLAAALPQPSRSRRVAPAIKNIGVTGTDERGRLGTGYRWSLDIDDYDVKMWASSTSGDARVQKYALAIGLAAVRYGFILVDNGGNRGRKIGSVYCEHDASANWDDIGFPKSVAQGLLTSLIRPNADSVYFLEEPAMVNIDDVATYPDVVYPIDM